jgi:hypothetical protein
MATNAGQNKQKIPSTECVNSHIKVLKIAFWKNVSRIISMNTHESWTRVATAAPHNINSGVMPSCQGKTVEEDAHLV